jgi:hypothetical protein
MLRTERRKLCCDAAAFVLGSENVAAVAVAAAVATRRETYLNRLPSLVVDNDLSIPLTERNVLYKGSKMCIPTSKFSSMSSEEIYPLSTYYDRTTIAGNDQ